MRATLLCVQWLAVAFGLLVVGIWLTQDFGPGDVPEQIAMVAGSAAVAAACWWVRCKRPEYGAWADLPWVNLLWNPITKTALWLVAVLLFAQICQWSMRHEWLRLLLLAAFVAVAVFTLTPRRSKAEVVREFLAIQNEVQRLTETQQRANEERWAKEAMDSIERQLEAARAKLRHYSQS